MSNWNWSTEMNMHKIVKNELIYHFSGLKVYVRRSQWPRGLSNRRSAAARLLRLWVQIPPGAWMFVCCVLSGRRLCDELISHPAEPTDCGASLCVI